MTLTAKDVAEIMRLLEQSSFDTLSLEIDGVKLNLQRGSAAPVRQPVAHAVLSRVAAAAGAIISAKSQTAVRRQASRKLLRLFSEFSIARPSPVSRRLSKWARRSRKIRSSASSR